VRQGGPTGGFPISDSPPRKPGLLAELMERRVGRAAAMYVVVAFALLQAADLLLPALGAPYWVFRVFVGVAFVGLPTTLALSWYFDLTPQGLKEADSEGFRGGRRAIWLRRSLLGLVGASALLLGGFAILRTLPSTVELDRNRIVVFPLVVPEGDVATSVGEDIATMIGHALDRAASLRWIDGWAFLDAEQQLNSRTLSLSQARSITTTQGSGRFVVGRVVAGADSVTVLLDLFDVAEELPLQRASARGSLDEPWAPGLRAASQLLPSLIGQVPADFAAHFTDRDPAAVAQFLSGEAAFRRARYAEALAGYQSAFDLDPAFPQAAIRGAQAASWRHRSQEASLLVEAALALDLTNRDRAFAEGLQAYLAGDSEGALAALERALALDPRMAAAHAQRGEVYHHLAPSRRFPDSVATEAFRQAHALDPTAGGVLYHLAQHRLRTESPGALRGLELDFRAAAADLELVSEIEVSTRCAVHGPGRVDWEEEAHQRPGPLMEAAVNLAGGEERWACAEAAYRALLAHDTTTSGWEVGRRWSSLKGLMGLLLATGRAEEAMALVDAAGISLDDLRAAADPWAGRDHTPDSGTGNPVQFAELLFLLAEAAGYPTDGRAEVVAAANRHEDGRYRSSNNARLWFMGIWEASRGNGAATRDVARRMEERLATGPGSVQDSLLSRAMAGHAALAEGDSTAAVEILRSLRPRGEIQWNEADALGYERLVHARLALALGRPSEAVDVTTWLEASPSIYPLFRPAVLEVRAAAMETLRQNSDARIVRERRDRLVTASRP
jgi:tetratricopeptide (TPR) repeat protein